MSYLKTTWVDDSTPLSAENLNKIEDALSIAYDTAERASSTASENNQLLSNLSETVTDLDETVDGLNEQLDNLINKTIPEHINNANQNFGLIASLSGDLGTISSSFGAHTSADNPHAITAAKINTYTATEIDGKLDPVKTIQGKTATGSTTGVSLVLPCENIGCFSQNLILDVKSHDTFSGGYLWDIFSGTSIASITASSLSTTLFQDSGFIWQQINADIPGVTTTINESFLSTLKAIPKTSLPSNENGSDTLFGGCAAITFNKNVNIVIALRNVSLGTYYLIPVGTDNDIRVYVYNNKLFIRRATAKTKHIIDVPEGTKLFTVFLDNTTVNTSTTCSIKYSSINAYSVSFACTGGTAASLTNMYQEGSYIIPYKYVAPATGTTFSVTGTLSGVSSVEAECTLSYFKDGTNLNKMLKFYETTAVNEENLKTATQKELQKLINIGTVDPAASTPGLVYFKYLP